MEENLTPMENVERAVVRLNAQADEIYLGSDMVPLSKVDLPTAVRFVIKQLRAMVKS